MAVTVSSLADLRRYFRGVVERSEHHGQSVADIVYPLLGLLLVHMDDESDLKVWGSEGSSANILWFYIGGRRYAFRYEHADRTVEIRAEKHTGSVVAKVTNTTPIAELRQVFERLRSAPAEEPAPLPAFATGARACELCGQSDGVLTDAQDAWGRARSFHEECAIYAIETLHVAPHRILEKNQWVADDEDLSRWRPKIQGARDTFGPTFDAIPAPRKA